MPNEKNLLAHAPTQPAMQAAPRPDERPTAALPKVDIAAMLTSLAADMKQVIGTGEKMSNDVDMLISDGRKTNLRLTRVEERIDEFDARLTRNSGRARAPSEHDLANEKRLADEIAAREALAAEVALVKKETVAQTAMLATISSAVEGVTGFVKQNPGTVASIVGALGTIFGWVTSYLQHRGH